MSNRQKKQQRSYASMSHEIMLDLDRFLFIISWTTSSNTARILHKYYSHDSYVLPAYNAHIIQPCSSLKIMPQCDQTTLPKLPYLDDRPEWRFRIGYRWCRFFHNGSLKANTQFYSLAPAKTWT